MNNNLCLDDYCEFIIDCEHKTAPIQDAGYPSIRTPNIGKGRLLLDGVNRVSENTYIEWTSRAVPQFGDLIFAREAPAGNVAIIPDNLKVCLGQRTVLIRPDNKKINGSYLMYLMLGHEIQGQLLGSAAGATVAHVNMKDIRTLRIPALPERKVQDKIASILSAYDDLIENNARRIRILEEMARRIYREWFVNFRFPGYKKTKMIESSIGRIPEGWRWEKLKDVCDSISYGFTASANNEVIGPKFLRITDIVPNTIEWDDVPYCEIDPKETEKYSLSEGDIVIARTGATTGYAKRLNKRHPKSVFASYLVRIRPNSVLGKHYAGVIVESNEYKEFIKQNLGGSAQPQANAQVLTSIDILVPAADMIQAFDKLMQPLADKKELLQIKNKNLRRTRDLLLPKLISGELRVEDRIAEEEAFVPVAKETLKAHKATEQFREAILIAALVRELSSDRFPLSRMRYQKNVYLVLRKTEYDVTNKFQKKAAGPYDHAMRYKGGEGIAVRNGYINRRDTWHFAVGDNIDEIDKYLPRYDFAVHLDWLFKEFKYRRNDDLELLTTVDYAVLELITGGKAISADNVEQLIASEPKWAPKLKRSIFSAENIQRALKELIQHFPGTYSIEA